MLMKAFEKYERIFLVIFVAYFVFAFLDKTMLSVDYGLVDTIARIGRYISYAGISLLAICNYKRVTQFIRDLFHKNKLLLAILFALFISIAVSFCIYRANPNMLVICVLMLASIGVDYKKILRWTYRMQFILSAIVLFLFFAGIASDYLVYRSNGDVRHSLGFIYTTTLPSFLSSSIILYACDKKWRNIPWYQIVLFVISNILLLFFTDSRMEFAITSGVILIIVIRKFYKDKKSGFLNGITNVVLSTFSKIFWALPILWFCLIMLFPNGGIVLEKANQILSNRLAQTYSVVTQEKAISAFGSDIVLKGNGADTRKEYGNYKSNFVDDDYIRGMVYHGILFTVSEILLFEAMLLLIWKRKNRSLLLFCTITLLAAFIDTRLMTIIYCPIFLLAVPVFADYCQCKKIKSEK